LYHPLGAIFVEHATPAAEHLMGVERLLRIAPWVDDGTDDGVGNERLVAGLRAREPWASAALVQRYREHVRRVLMRLLGADDPGDAGELVQDVFVRAWRGIGGLKDPRALKAWLTHIAVFTARAAIRRRRRRRWLSFFAEVPEPEVAWAGSEMKEAARAVYLIFERMPADERIPFALRNLDGSSLEETAHACGMSFATVRRRLARAERRFLKLAREYEALQPWLEQR
jgi:RNA polymerase sigma-70 factor, ECF subfamily